MLQLLKSEMMAILTHLVWPLTCRSPDPDLHSSLPPELSLPDASLALILLRVAANFWGVFSLFLVLFPRSLKGKGLHGSLANEISHVCKLKCYYNT